MKTKRFHLFLKLLKKCLINNKIIFIFILGILLFPVLFLLFFRFYYFLLPGEEIGSKGDWISFSGGYIGSILTLTGVWWQLHLSQKKEYENETKKYKTFKKYIRKIVDFNLEELEKSRDNLAKTYAYHFGFVDRREIFDFKEIEETIFKKYFDKIVEENDNILIDLYDLQLSLKKYLESVVTDFNQKKEIFCKILNLKKKKELKIEILEKKEKKNPEKEEIKASLAYYREQLSIFNNFISSSLLVCNPKSERVLFYFYRNSIRNNGFITSQELAKTDKYFKKYTANNRIKNEIEEIREKTPIALYWRFYEEIINVLIIPRTFSSRYDKAEIKEYEKVYYLIDKVRANDLRRKKILKEYENLLKKCKEKL